MSDQGITTIIGRNATFDGDVYVEGSLFIEGALSGKVTCSDTLIIRPGAHVVADLRAQDILIAGYVEGAIEAQRHLTLEKTAMFQGRITTPALSVEEGAVLRGMCDTESEKGFWRVISHS